MLTQSRRRRHLLRIRRRSRPVRPQRRRKRRLRAPCLLRRRHLAAGQAASSSRQSRVHPLKKDHGGKQKNREKRRLQQDGWGELSTKRQKLSHDEWPTAIEQLCVKETKGKKKKTIKTKLILRHRITLKIEGKSSLINQNINNR